MRETVTCMDKDGKAYEIAANDLIFRPSVYAIIIKDGAVLLSPQWDGYDFPGGGVERGEPLLEALLREVKEETGLTASDSELLYIHDGFWIAFDGKPYHSIQIYFTCNEIAGEISTDGFTEDEKGYVQAARWIPLEQVDGLKFYNGVDSPAIIKKAANLI